MNALTNPIDLHFIGFKSEIMHHRCAKMLDQGHIDWDDFRFVLAIVRGGSVSAAARMKMVKGKCLDPEIFVSSLTLIPLRSKAAEQEISGKDSSETSIKRASKLAADEIGEMAEKHNAYEHTLIEITVARTLRSIMDSVGPAA